MEITGLTSYHFTHLPVTFSDAFQLPSYEALVARLNMFMGQYNEQVKGANMDLVFFKDAFVHIMKVFIFR